jgi:hypothetical protein
MYMRTCTVQQRKAYRVSCDPCSRHLILCYSHSRIGQCQPSRSQCCKEAWLNLKASQTPPHPPIAQGPGRWGVCDMQYRVRDVHQHRYSSAKPTQSPPLHPPLPHNPQQAENHKLQPLTSSAVPTAQSPVLQRSEAPPPSQVVPPLQGATLQCRANPAFTRQQNIIVVEPH